MKTILLALLCMTVLIGCGDSVISPPSSAQASGYFPLEVGYKWKYKITGGIGGFDTIAVYSKTVESSQVFNGKTYFKVVTVFEDKSSFVTFEYYRTENNKVYLYIDGKDSLYIDLQNMDTTLGYSIETLDSTQTLIGTLNNVRKVKWTNSNKNVTLIKEYVQNIGLVSSWATFADADAHVLIYAKIGGKVYP